MNLELAKKIAQPYTLNKDNKTIVITSDHGVHLNSDIMNVCKFAVRSKLKYFVIKGEEPTLDQIKDAIFEQTQQLGQNTNTALELAVKKNLQRDLKEAIKRGDYHAERKDFVKARAVYAQAAKMVEGVEGVDGSEAAQKRDEMYAKLVEISHIAEETQEEKDAKAKADVEAGKINKLKARAVAVGLPEDSDEKDIKAAEKLAKEAKDKAEADEKSKGAGKKGKK